MTIIEKNINSITPYERNPRLNDNAVDAVAASIKEFGFKNPIIIDKDGVIVAGHTRLRAAKKLGLETVPCIMADDLTPEQIKAFRLADNKTAELADWDLELLDLELADIDLDMEPFGFVFDDDEEQAPSGPDGYYTSKTDIPQYQPSGENVTLSECLNDAKYTELLMQIEGSEVTAEEKAFLEMAAARHLCFNYQKIADYYAGKASPEMQKLMEASALVLIDYNDAIKNGYAILRKTVMDLVTEDGYET